jgi:transposase
MPVIHSTSVFTKAHVLNLIDCQNESIRRVAAIVQIPKSTLHDNLPKYRAQIAFLQAQEDRHQDIIEKSILSIIIEGKSSCRDCTNVIETTLGVKISHQAVLKFLMEASVAAKELNKESHQHVDGKLLSKITALGGDEIFQSNKPILVSMDLASSYLHLACPGDRSKESWTKFLQGLKDDGLDPMSVTADGGKAGLESVKSVFPGAVRILDLFHVLKVLTAAKRSIEGKCYRFIDAYFKGMEKFNKTLMDEAIDLFDKLEPLIEKFRLSCYISSQNGYVPSLALEGQVDSIVMILNDFIQIGVIGDKIRKARSYLKNGSQGIVAYKKMLEKAVKSAYGDHLCDTMLSYICPIVEVIDQLQREKEDKVKASQLQRKIIDLRAKFRAFDWINQDEVDNAIQKAVAIMSGAKKSNSLIETANSVIRRYLVTYKTIPSWFCDLFTFFWNNRRFARGKRAKLKPIEILSGQHFEASWVDTLVGKIKSNRQAASSPAS